MTVRSLPLKRTLAPLDVGCSPSPASMTPALTSSSLYFVIASRSSVPGISPASDSGLPGTRTMKRIATSSWGLGWFLLARRTKPDGIDTPREKFCTGSDADGDEALAAHRPAPPHADGRAP